MIDATKFKLNEARFFLDQLRGEEMKQEAAPQTADLTTFFCYLSAFLSASRSVRRVLESEETDKYKAWEPSWKRLVADAEDELIALTELRDTERIETISRPEKVPIRENDHPIYGFHYYGLPGVPVETNGNEREIVAACEEYVTLLARMVQDFIDKHPVASC